MSYRYLIHEMELAKFSRITWFKAHLVLGKVCFLYKCIFPYFYLV